MNTPPLPYAPDWEWTVPDQPAPALAEMRALRDAYSRKAVVALQRRFPHMAPAGWQAWADELARLPVAGLDGLGVLLDMLPDPEGWAAVSRFGWLCEKVWTAECNELEDLCHGRSRKTA